MAEETQMEIEIPRYFLCPISLEIMKDPVIVLTGITYDRESIEKWLFSGGNAFCPVTKQALDDLELTPNVTLRRVIQSWCAAHGVQRLPTPRPAVNRWEISKTLVQAKSPEMQIKCLKRIKSIASSNHSNRRAVEAAGAVEFLASFIIRKSQGLAVSEQGTDSNFSDLKEARDEALSILFSLQLSTATLASLNNAGFIDSLTKSMQNGSLESRTHSIVLLHQILESADSDTSVLIGLQREFFVESARILKDQISHKASKSALEALAIACPWGRNRVKAVEAGTVQVLIELLINSPPKRPAEMILIALDLLCQCAEGRAALLAHAAGLAVVSKKILRISTLATDRAVKILHSITRFSGTPGVLHEMLQIGVAAKLSLVLQVNRGGRTHERCWEIIKAATRTWRSPPCIPKDLLSLLPSS